MKSTSRPPAIDIHAAARAYDAGRRGEADAICREVVASNPRHADAWHLLGCIANDEGRAVEAESLVQRALDVYEHPAFLATLSRLARGRPDEESVLRRWVAADPREAKSRYALARLLAEQGQLGPAESQAREALALRPGSHIALNLLGNVLRDAGRPAQAELAYREAISRRDNYAQAWSNLGILLHDDGRLDEARKAHERAVALDAAVPAFHNNLAAVLQEQGDAAGAEAAFRAALQASDGFAPARMNLGMLLLEQGRYEQAWPLFEARAHTGHQVFPEPPPPPCQPWQGESLAGKSIVIWPEQGMGDMIQFVRFATELKQRKHAAHVVVACPQPLQALFSNAQGVDRVITSPQSLGACDYWCYALGLPMQLQSTLDTLPARLPYLRPEPACMAQWHKRLPEGYKVGLCWKGSPRHGNDAHRSLPHLRALAALWQVKGVNFISLQKGQGESEAASPPAGQALLDLGSAMADFADAAAIVAQLDLVITVDTAMAHLAGALGKPVWVLVPATATDWRWLRRRTDSPWYPRVMRLFRQQHDGQWEAPVRDVAAALESRVLLAEGRRLKQDGKVAQAESALRRAIELDPAAHAPHAHLGQLLIAAGRLDEALPVSELELRLHPHSAEAHSRRSALAWMRKDMPQAEASAREALRLDAASPSAHTNLGAVLQTAGRMDEAIEQFREAIRLDPHEANSMNNLGSILSDRREDEEAEALFRRAIDADPQFLPARTNYSTLLLRLGRREEAKHWLREALRLDPANTDVLNNLGAELQTEGRLDEALPLLLRAMSLRTNFEIAGLNLGSLYLAQGDFERGWPIYEMRRSQSFKTNRLDVPTYLPFPEWQGESLKGKSIVIWPEQGYGDEIQFVRYATLLKARGAREVVVVCKKALHYLMRNAKDVDRVATWRKPVPRCDYWTMALTLPMRFGTTVDTIPAHIPYLRPAEARIAKWRKRLPAGTNVGLVWKGAKVHGNDAQRSLASVTMLASLWEVPGVNFISLQKGQGEDESAASPAGQPLTPLGAEMEDFADAAGIVSQLDLVICVDTAIAHLAGAMGKPVWVLVPSMGTDWRWLFGRDDSPWYPGVMRLFRQKPGDGWTPVIDQLAVALREFMRGR